MSTLKDMFHRSQSISVAAKEEYQRFGHPEADLEHVFLALIIVGGSSGRVLGDLGVTLHRARNAAERVHAEQISSLGLTPPASLASSTIPDPQVGEIRWADRALKVMRHDNSTGDDRILLTHLLDEPSGHVVRIVEQLGLSESRVRESIDSYVDDAEPVSVNSPATKSHDTDTNTRPSEWENVVYSGHIPVAPELVWALVSDPARRVEWDGLYYESAVLGDDGVLTTFARMTRPDGKPSKIKPEFRRTEHVVSRYTEGTLIEWESMWPDRPRSRFVARLRIEVRPDGTGTAIVITQSRRKRRNLVWRALSPLYRFFTWQGLFSRATAISRALR
jgi:ATP-dependent Clp protease ATP-binding subunit ClpA